MLWNVTSEFLTIAVSIEGDQPELSHDHIFIYLLIDSPSFPII